MQAAYLKGCARGNNRDVCTGNLTDFGKKKPPLTRGGGDEKPFYKALWKSKESISPV